MDVYLGYCIGLYGIGTKFRRVGRMQVLFGHNRGELYDSLHSTYILTNETTGTGMI